MNLRTRSVDFALTSEAMSPDAITQQLGIDPDRFFVIGQPTTQRKNAPVARFHMWSIGMDGMDEDDLNEMIEQVVARLRGEPTNRLRELIATSDCVASLNLYINTPSWHEQDESDNRSESLVRPAFSLSDELVNWLAFVGASLDVDIY